MNVSFIIFDSELRNIIAQYLEQHNFPEGTRLDPSKLTFEIKEVRDEISYMPASLMDVESPAVMRQQITVKFDDDYPLNVYPVYPRPEDML